MEMPNVIHPKRIKINGFIYEVVTYQPVGDQQAVGIARASHALKRPRGALKGKVIQVYSQEGAY